MSGRPPPDGSPGSWKLAAEVAAQAQALVVSGFVSLPAARALLLRARPETRGGAWIGALEAVAPITAADGKLVPSTALAFTSTGLAQLGLDILGDAGPPGAADRGKVGLVGGFALPFVEGMMQEDRRRRLGDAADGPEPVAIEWSGGSPHGARTKVDVHAILLAYEESHEALAAHVASIETALAGAGVDVVRDIALDLRIDEGSFPREHFGFADGISQPIPYGEGTSDGAGGTYPQDSLHGVPLGEILLGHRDAHGQTSSGPFLAGALDTDGAFVPSRAPADEAAVAAMMDPGAQKLCDLGLNGAYLVVRELRQDVKGFRDSLEREARALNARSPGKPAVDADWLAARIVGRTRDGHVLRPGGPLPPGPDGAPDNDFLYFAGDRLGRGCPMGSHVRRANPRDGLAYKEEVGQDLLRSANAHRLLRRGRKFGGDVAGSDTSGDEGLLFIALNGDIARQFEFVQQNWMLNPNFSTLFDEVDPLVGPQGAMTLPDIPLRRRVQVETYVTLVGGDYFFLPSLPALRILRALGPSAATPGPAT